MANTRITQGVIKPNEDYDVRHINATGIVTAASVDVTNNLSVGGVLTYEDVTNVDSVGLITARKGIISSGVVTATAFHGSGASLTGIDATALKDPAGNVKVQAQASGAVHTGISTFDTINVGSGVTIESNGQATFTGIVTFGSGSTTIDNNVVNVGTALTLGHTQGLQFHTQNLHSAGFEINQINASGIITASSFSGDGSNLTSLPAGLGTALSSTQSSPLNKIYYTNTILPVESTVTVDTPASASAAYTQYADISVGTGADLIISDGDDLIPDVLGLRPDGTFGGGALGRMRVDKIVGKDAISAVNFEKGIVVTGVVTATSYRGDGSQLTGIVADKIFEGNTEVETIDTGSDGHIKFTTEGSERLRIDNNGKVLIATSTTSEAHANNDELIIGGTSDDNNHGLTIVTPSSKYGTVAFSDGSSGTGQGLLEYNHSGDYMRIYTAGSERFRIDAGGNMNVTGVVTATSFSGDGSALTGTGVGSNSSINTTGIITATSLVQNSAFSHRNKLYNGDMRIAQRGDAHTNVGNNASTYTLDRWKLYVQNTSARFQIERNYDHSLPDGFRTSMRISCTTTDTSLAATDEVYLTQSLEGNDVFDFAKGTPSAKQYTLSFYARSDKTGTYIVTLLGRDNTASTVSASYTITNTWTRYVITFPADTNSSRKDNPDNGEALRVMWWLVAGSGVNNGTLATTWRNSTDTGRATGQVNFADNNSNRDFYLTGCQLEVGPVATPFEYTPYTEQLTRCQRYYQKDINRRAYWGSGNVSGRYFPVHFITEMRATPSISFHSTSLDSGSASAHSATRQGYNFNMSGSGRFYEWAHIATAEI